MSISKNFETFLVMLYKKSNNIYVSSLNDKKNKTDYIMAGNMIKSIMYQVNLSIKKQLQVEFYNDYIIYNGYISNKIENSTLSDFIPPENLINDLQYIDEISEKGKNIITNYINIFTSRDLKEIFDDNYKNLKIACYFNWLFLPIFLRWKISKYENNENTRQIIENFNKEMSIFNIQFNENINYSDYYTIIYNSMNTLKLINVVPLLEKISGNYNNYDYSIKKIKKLKIVDEKNTFTTSNNIYLSACRDNLRIHNFL